MVGNSHGHLASWDLEMSEVSQGPGWWLASDGRWYAPERHPNYVPPPPPPALPVVDYASQFPYPGPVPEAAKRGGPLERLVGMGPLRGRPRNEIESILGPPSSITATGYGGQLVSGSAPLATVDLPGTMQCCLIKRPSVAALPMSLRGLVVRLAGHPWRGVLVAAPGTQSPPPSTSFRAPTAAQAGQASASGEHPAPGR